MTNGEYQQLVEVLQGQFVQVDRRFDRLEHHLDAFESHVDGRLDRHDPAPIRELVERIEARLRR